MASDPAFTAFELSDPCHAPTSDCGMVPGGVTVVGDVGTAVLLQLVTTSALISGRMKLLVRTRSKSATWVPIDLPPLGYCRDARAV